MAHGIWNTPSGRQRRWGRRQGGRYFDMPAWAGYIIVVCAVVLCGEMIWQGVQWVRRPASPAAIVAEGATPSGRDAGGANLARANSEGNSGVARTESGASAANGASAAEPAWQSDALQSFAAGSHDATGGNITAAEMALDRGAELIAEARGRAEQATPDFFSATVEMLNRALRGHESNERLEEHATLARIELAQLRSAQNEPGGAAAGGGQPLGEPENAGGEGAAQTKGAPSVAIYAPRSIAANETLNPVALGAEILDARMMPDASEILLPPSTRAFEDNVHVDHLRLEGAAQTLDGIHWSNVVFADTRVRYEGHGLDLQKVKFVRCTFGFPVDARGARLANAVALGQTSIAMEPSPPAQVVPSDVDPNDVNP
ncbi:MAG TPA: hypothetical protein VIC00_06050 [Candidatus Acidoferrales bacterium]